MMIRGTLSRASDQAEGLRRMLGFGHAPVIALAAGGAGDGKTSCAINLAAALARFGRRVLIIDENYGPANAAGLLGLRARFDLQHALHGTRSLDEVIVGGMNGVYVLPAANGVRLLARLKAHEQERALACFERLDGLADVVLVDARAGRAAQAASAAEEVAVLLTPAPSSITAAYALIKRLRQDHGRRRFRVLVNRASDEAAARRIFDNMARAAHGYLDVALDFMGRISADGAIARAAREFSAVVEAYPDTPAAADFRRLASGMIGWTSPPATGRGLDGFMQRVIQSGRPACAGAGA